MRKSYMYRTTREGDFLRELLKGFHGVLVSDFYAAYDSLECPQQKCLIHLIRDFNHDVQRTKLVIISWVIVIFGDIDVGCSHAV